MGAIRAILIVAMAAMLTACMGTSLPGGGIASSGTTYPAVTAPSPFTSLMNNARSAASRGPLVVNSRLTAAAQAHADDMSINDYFSHTSMDGRSMGDRIRATGYSYCWAAENIAAGQSSQTAVFNDWMASSGHKANMLSAKAKEFGLGHATGGSYGDYWVLNLGNPGPSC